MENSNKAHLNDKSTHPCFSESAHLNYARMHLPVAPECNIHCNYCNRKYDCQNESRPGVTSEILTPEQAFHKFIVVKNKIQNLSVVGFAGPGDTLSNFDKVKETIGLIKQDSPDIVFCLSTNGLMLPYYAQEIIDIGVSHVTVTINAIDTRIGACIYSEINYKDKKLTGEEGSKILIENQLTGLKYLSDRGIICKVNIVALKNINHSHIEEVVKTVKQYGAFKSNITPLIPTKGTKFENLSLVSKKELNEIRQKCSAHLSQMYYCRQCRADAVGLLNQDRSSEFRNLV